MNAQDSGSSGSAESGLLSEKTIKLLEKALALSPGDWETRGHLISHYLAAGEAPRAQILLQ